MQELPSSQRLRQRWVTLSIALAATAAFSTLMTLVRSAGIVPMSELEYSYGTPAKLFEQDRSTIGSAFFEQPLHHANFDLGFFNECYYWNATFWKGPGSPIILFLPGEGEASGFLALSRPDVSTVGVIAETIGAAVVILEHRYFGKSSPFELLTTANLTYLTIENSLADIVRFAKQFEAPWAPGIRTTASDVPFVLVGGSYSGGQTAWIAEVMPGTFWAYIASSPALHAKSDYWEYMLPVLEHGGSNCVDTLAGIIDYVDATLTGSFEEVRRLKESFGLGEMEHNDDFAFELSWPILLWRDRQLGDHECRWCQLCKQILSPNISVPGLKGAPQALGSFIHSRKSWNASICTQEKCRSSYDPHNRLYTDYRVDNAGNRQIEWLRCNEHLGGWITSAPAEKSNITLVSRLITLDYWQRQCLLHFPSLKDETSLEKWKLDGDARLNAHTGGWKPTNVHRIIYSSGEKDSWRELGASAKSRPGGPMKSNKEQDIVVEVIEEGWHTSDLFTRPSALSPQAYQVQIREIDQISKWIEDWNQMVLEDTKP